MDKFGSMEHMTAIDVGLVRAQAIVVTLPFRNWEEEWEAQATLARNVAYEDSLKNKYVHLFLCDNDTIEIRRIIDIEWREKLPGKNQARAQYHLVCKLVAKDNENYTGDEDLEPYLINESDQSMPCSLQ
jgi:hypothetical protein